MGKESDYETGFGKPPKHSQFKKGQSGNPKGRPKKRKTRKELFEEAWQTEITVNGKTMTKAEAFVLSLMNDGIKGKASARNLLMAELPDFEDELEDFEESVDDKVAMLQVMKDFQQRGKEAS